MKYAALLRGINVGGKNKVPMTDLKKCLEDLGFSNVSTYIASGNVFLESEKPARVIKAQIEKTLPKSFKLDSKLVKVLVLTAKQVKTVAEDAPKGFGKEPKKFRYDVLFIMPPLTPAKAMAAIELKEGVDYAWAGRHAIYFRRLEARVTSSRVSKIVGKPEYQLMTLRNWNTTQKIEALVENK
jgi:uncharacterized protein (DUF1697 family)